MRLASYFSLAAILLAGCGQTGSDEDTDTALANEAAALAADHDWLAALESGDRKGTAALIDREFEWIDIDGRTWDAETALESTDDLLDDLSSDAAPASYHYGHVEVITSARARQLAMRVWVLRPEGWRIFQIISTALESGATPFAATEGAAQTGDCENPCRSMPYTPQTPNERTIADLFMQLKMDEWHPDPDRWAPYVLDGVDYTTATAQLSKEARVAHLRALASTGAPSVPGDPVVSMRIFDFGDAAVMRAQHTPYAGGRPYLSVRVWAFRDGRWQLANTQQTVIRDALPAAPI